MISSPKPSFDDLERIAGKYGSVYPLYQDSDTIMVGDNKGRATIYGMRDEDMATVLTVDEGALPKTASSVVVGPSFAERHDLTIGSRITIGDDIQKRVGAEIPGRGDTRREGHVHGYQHR